MRKKFLAAALALAMAVAACPFALAEGEEARSPGVPAELSAAQVTRADFCKKIYETIAPLDDKYDDASAITPKFSDVSSSASYYSAVKYCYNKGIMVGYTDGKFRPSESLTRVEAATAIDDLTWLPSYDGPTLEIADASHGDSYWYWRWEVEKLVGLQIMFLDGENRFNPEAILCDGDINWDTLAACAEGTSWGKPPAGTCGAPGNETRVTWKVEQNTDTGSKTDLTLTIAGSGAMDDFVCDWHTNLPPWCDYDEAITKVIVTGRVTHIGNEAFGSAFSVHQMPNLTEVIVESGYVTTIGRDAFRYAPITSIELPDSVESIGISTFSGTKLQSFKIGKNVQTLSYGGGLGDCPEILLDDRNPYFSMIDGVLYDKDVTRLVLYPDLPNTSYVIPETVKGQSQDEDGIGISAFWETNLQNIVAGGNTKLFGVPGTPPDGLIFVPSNLTTFYLKDGATQTEVKESLWSWRDEFWSEGCNVYEYTAPVQEIRFANDQYTLELEYGGAPVAHAAANLSEGGGAITYSCSDESVASVDPQSGVVTPLAPGYAVVTATAAAVDGKWAETSVHYILDVKPIRVTGVTLNSTEVSLEVGGSMTLTATVTPDNASDKSVTWRSSDPEIVAVAQDGTITALRAGEATVTVKTSDEYDFGYYTASCKVTVLPITGNFGENSTLSYTYKGAGELTFTGDLPQDETVFVACFDDTGRFTGVKCVNRQFMETQVGAGLSKIKLFWLSEKQTPQCGAKEIALTSQ